jgi:hypothetical protein
MAIVTNNDVVKGFRGKFGNDIVFRTMRGKTFANPPASKPDKKRESAAQRNTRINFREAAEWAQLILLDPEKKAYYKQRAKVLKLPNAYTAAITDYMRKPKVKKTQHRDTITYSVSKPGFVLECVKAMANDTTSTSSQKIVTRQHKNRWLIHYTPDENSLSSFTLIITDNAEREIQFTDVPIEHLTSKI